jgi:aspartate kinase
MVTIVQKFGGTSVETPNHLIEVARRISDEKRKGRRLIVVVSAMGQSTDELVALALRVSPSPPRREMDMLLTAGERISMALLAIALDSLGTKAISFTGSQSGIITDDRHSDARIAAIRPFRIEESLSQDKIVIVAGFQGVSLAKEITTLGRGGSDTTAVALAIRFTSPWCDIFTDVHGVLTADPRIVPTARTLPQIDYEPTIVLSHLGAGVLFRRSVILARKYGMPIRVGCSLSAGPETWIGPSPKESEMPETPLSKPGPSRRGSGAGPDKMRSPDAATQSGSPDFPTESDRILSVALESHCTLVEIEGCHALSKLAALLDDVSAPQVWLWVESLAGESKNVVRGVCAGSGPDSKRLGEAIVKSGAAVHIHSELAVASLVGEGILARPSLLREALDSIVEAGIEVRAARSGSLSLSFLVEKRRAADLVRLLHDRFVTAETS